MAVTFESYERRIDQIKPVMEKYGIKDFEDSLKICTDKGFNPYEIVKGVQPICFENAAWAYTLGAAIAIKKGCKKASDAAKAIGEGLQAFCIPGSVADDRKVGLGHGNLASMLLSEDTKCFAFLAGHESFAAAEGAIGIAKSANKVRKEPLRVILNGLGKDAAQIISRINGFTYVKTDFDYFTGKVKVVEEIKYSDLSRTQGVEIKLTDNVKKRIKKLIPPEAMPSDDYLRLSPDREYCLNDMKRCMQNDLAETAWLATQYLWKLHPIFNWIEDKAGVFYKRSEVPVLGLTNSIGAEDILFIVAGLIPNRKSTTVVDEWFGVLYKNDQFDNILSMNEVLQKTHLNVKVPNTQNVTEEQIARGQKLLGDVVNRAKKIMADKCAEYKEKTDPYIYEEMERLEQLEQRHKAAQLSFFDLGIPGMERKKSEKEREIEAIFTNFMDWEKDTLEIEENP